MTAEARAEAAAWLLKAETDLRAARVDMGADPPIASDALFHCQQAVEKALKGLLAAHERQLPRTHDLESLGHRVLRLEPSLHPVITETYFLSVYASEFRYPGPMAEPDAATTKAAIELATRAVTAVDALLESRGPLA